MDFKKKIEEKGLKITWIAKQIGVSQPLLSMYLNKTRSMPNHVEDSLNEVLS